jgi:hypothetical protein
MARCQPAPGYCLQALGEFLSAIMYFTLETSRTQISSLDDVDAATTSDASTVKSIALDHLGVIAARLRSTSARLKARESDPSDKHIRIVKSLEEVLPLIYAVVIQLLRT